MNQVTVRLADGRRPLVTRHAEELRLTGAARGTIATRAIQHDARKLGVLYLLGHASPDMVRRYPSSYRSEQAATRHVWFSLGDQMLDSA